MNTLERDKQKILTALKAHKYDEDLPWELLKTDRDLALKAVKINGCLLKDLPRKFRADYDIAATAADRCVTSLKYCGRQLRGNETFMLARIKNCEIAYCYAAPSLKRKKSFAKKSLQTNGYVVEYLPKKFQKDPILQAVSKSKIKIMSGNDETDKEYAYISIL